MIVCNRFSRFSIFAALLFISLLSCSKTNESATSLIYSNWAFTGSHGTVVVNNMMLGASQGSNSDRNIIVGFQQTGKYNFNIPAFIDETDGFSLADSTIILHSDTSYLAYYCGYPAVYYGTTPGMDPPKPQPVSNRLNIVFISRDSLLVRTDLVKPGNNAPDTIYTEFTGFRKK